MRNPLAAGFLLCVFSILPAAAATCPGTIVLQDPFTSQTPAWDATVYSQTKFLIQGGKAEVFHYPARIFRVEEYWGARYGDVNLCITVASPATDKSEGQVGGLVFWATDYNSYYSLMVNPANGQFAVTQKLPSGQWAFPVAWAANPAVVQGLGKANALRVQTRGKTATLFINDQQVGHSSGRRPPVVARWASMLNRKNRPLHRLLRLHRLRGSCNSIRNSAPFIGCMPRHRRLPGSVPQRRHLPQHPNSRPGTGHGAGWKRRNHY